MGGEVAHFLAVDLGAESGRGILGTLTYDRLEFSEVHRFSNGPITFPDGSLRWDFDAIMREVWSCITLAAERVGRLDGIAVDTWGVDYGLLDPNGALVSAPYHYRDARTANVMEKVFEVIPKDEIYRRTGIQFMELNTLYQLVATVRDHPECLERAAKMLLMPDLIEHSLCGAEDAEFTIATTTQCYDPISRTWATDLTERLGIPTRLFPPVIAPGTVLGPLSGGPSIVHDTSVIATAGHDTACAVAAVPATQERYAYLSSGTWSLMGVELAEPLISKEALEANFTNEGGVTGFRFLKNIGGLWVLQECRRSWAEDGVLPSWETLMQEAETAPAFLGPVDPDDPAFLRPGNMPERVNEWCRQQGLRSFQSRGEMTRAILEGLAIRYRITLELLRRVTGRTIETIHIVGGGSRNKPLCRFTADATGCQVVAGPAEATAAGNILIQARATGHFGSYDEARAVIRNSVSLETYEPRTDEAWEDAVARFAHLFGGALG